MTVKADLYAILGVHQYWVADLQNDRLLSYSDASDGAYRSKREFHRNETLMPLLLPDCTIAINDLLP